MFEWIKRRRLLPADIDRPQAGGLKTPGRPMVGKYALLYEYLEHRYANSVVLTFAQIEDVVGFALPDQARVRRGRGGGAGPGGAGARHAGGGGPGRRGAVAQLLPPEVAVGRAVFWENNLPP